MENQLKEIVGSWIVMIGTITYAIGSTPSSFLREETLEDLVIIGNVLQAMGNVLEAEGQGDFTLETLGNELQATGNATVITGLLLPLDEEDEQKTVIAGTWIQVLGGLVALSDEFYDATDADDSYNISGNLLQSIGNSLQAKSLMATLLKGQSEKNTENDKNETESEQQNNDSIDPVFLTGVWIQAVGSVIALIGQIKEETEELRRKQGYVYPGSRIGYTAWSENYTYS